MFPSLYNYLSFDGSEYLKFLYLNCGQKKREKPAITIIVRSLRLRQESLKKIRLGRESNPHDRCDTGAVLKPNGAGYFCELVIYP